MVNLLAESIINRNIRQIFTLHYDEIGGWIWKNAHILQLLFVKTYPHDVERMRVGSPNVRVVLMSATLVFCKDIILYIVSI